MLDEQKMQRTLLHVMNLLVTRQYEALYELDRYKALEIQHYKEATEEWPARDDAYHYIMPPTTNIYQLVREGNFEGGPETIPETWDLDAYLWTEEEGESEQTLRLIIEDAPGDMYNVEVREILVM